MSSYAGYHTPIEDEIAAGSMIIEGEGVSDIPSDNGALTVGRGSYHTQVIRGDLYGLSREIAVGIYRFRHHLRVLR